MRVLMPYLTRCNQWQQELFLNIASINPSSSRMQASYRVPLTEKYKLAKVLKSRYPRIWESTRLSFVSKGWIK